MNLVYLDVSALLDIVKTSAIPIFLFHKFNAFCHYLFDGVCVVCSLGMGYFSMEMKNQ